MSTEMNIFNILVIVFIGILYAFMPKLMNKYLLFGVTINDEILNDPVTKDVIQAYRRRVTSSTIFTVSLYLICSLLLQSDIMIMLYIAIIFLQLILLYYFFYRSHKKIKEIKRRIGFKASSFQTIDTNDSKEFKVISPIWYMIFVVLTVAVSIISLDRFPSLPDKIAIHFDQNGIADGFADKSYWTILSIPFLMLLMTGLFIGINYVMKKAKKVSGISKRKVSFDQENRFRYIWSIGLYLIGLAVQIIFIFVQLMIIVFFASAFS